MRRSLVLILAIAFVALPATTHAGVVVPVNDNFDQALALTGPLPALASQSTAGATIQVDEEIPSCIDNGEFGASVWYKYTPADQVYVALDTLGSDYDTVVAIYTGSAVDTLTEIACNDDISSNPATGGISRAAALLEGGTTYYFQISGFEAATGNLQLKLVKHRTLPGVVRGNKWYLNAGFDPAAESVFTFGSGGDDPFTGTFLGLLFGQTGVSTPAVRDGNSWLLNDWFDGTYFVGLSYGKSTDFPVAGDRDADGDSDIGVVRGNTWFFDTDLNGATDDTFTYGLATDYPIMGDWDGNGTFTPGIIRGNKWYLNNNTDGFADLVVPYGSSTDFPIPGDWDGDGVWSPGVVRGNFWLLNNGTDPNADVVFQYGSATDFPVVGDWDGAVES